MIYSTVTFASLLVATQATEPNPPNWPETVSVFDPSMSQEEIEAVTEAAFALNGHYPSEDTPETGCQGEGEWSDYRFAFLFKPGSYEEVNVPMGYYTSAYGLGMAPTDTVFQGTNGAKGVYAEEDCGVYETGALGTFWRSAENFHSKSMHAWEVGAGMSWVVSQAAPVRNVKVDNDLLLFEYIPASCCAAGYASGGWASGMDVNGYTKFGSQQQFAFRSSDLHQQADLPVWNGVFMASLGAPTAQCGASDDTGSTAASVTNEKEIPLLAEKPYITFTNEKYQLVVPPAKANVEAGLPWSDSGQAGSTIIDFENVYVTQLTDTSAIMQAKLDEGLHVVISAGQYQLDDSLTLKHENQVLLGIGYATLKAPSNGKPCIVVDDVDGVRIAGMLLQAGAWQTGAMMQVGVSGSFSASPTNPVVLTDVFARVGGTSNGMGPVDAMFLVQSGNTVIDNTWLWRADHGTDGLVKNGENPAKNGLVVNADHVYAYGLAVEHTNEDNVVWNGNDGVTFFFQAEIMYDYTGDVWDHNCYKVGSNVTTHHASGLGCYSFFRDYASECPVGFSVPEVGGVVLDKAVNIYLNGVNGSKISNIVNHDGGTATATHPVAYHCEA